MTRRTRFFVDKMDREAKAGRSPDEWLTAQCARLKLGAGFAHSVRLDYEQRLANRAKKAERAKHTATCQICARAIQANTGLIAHHGYTRPGQGWQTASCYGARKLPYEESCNAIPPYIDIVRAYGERQLAHAAAVLADPPAEYKVDKRLPSVYRAYLPEHFHVYTRPAIFGPARALAGEYSYYDPAYKYAMQFRSDVRGAEAQAKNAADEVARMEQRYKDWKPKA